MKLKIILLHQHIEIRVDPPKQVSIFRYVPRIISKVPTQIRIGSSVMLYLKQNFSPLTHLDCKRNLKAMDSVKAHILRTLLHDIRPFRESHWIHDQKLMQHEPSSIHKILFAVQSLLLTNLDMNIKTE